MRLRIRDWISDACSSDLSQPFRIGQTCVYRLITRMRMDLWFQDFQELLGRLHFRVIPELFHPLLHPFHFFLLFLIIEAKLGKITLCVFVPRIIKKRHEFRSEEHTSELKSLMRISYAVFCLKKTRTQSRKPSTYAFLYL